MLLLTDGDTGGNSTLEKLLLNEASYKAREAHFRSSICFCNRAINSNNLTCPRNLKFKINNLEYSCFFQAHVPYFCFFFLLFISVVKVLSEFGHSEKPVLLYCLTLFPEAEFHWNISEISCFSKITFPSFQFIFSQQGCHDHHTE